MIAWVTLLAAAATAVNLHAQSPTQLVTEALADARKLPPGIRPLVRYLSIANLADKPTALKVLTFHCNQLSRNPDLIPPTVVSPNLVRVNLLDYSWDSAVWEKLAAIDPYYHVQVETEEVERWGIKQSDGTWTQTETRKTGKKTRQGMPASWLPPAQIAELSTTCGSAVPIARADWWFVQTARQLSLTNKETGAGYYDFLGVKNRKDFEKLIRLNVKDSVAIGRDMRAAVEHSGVATQGRQIVRYQALSGGAWVTLDVDDATGEGNPLRNLKVGTFKHKAEEHIASLPNGLAAWFLCQGDEKGERQSTAPDFIGADDSAFRVGRDARIHPCLSCVRCHVEASLRPIDDWARRRAKNINSPDYGELLTLRRQYFSNLNRQLDKDRAVYREALRETNGWTPQENAMQFAAFYDAYVEMVTTETAAREMGVTVDALRRTFASSSDPSLAGLAAEPSEPMTRVHAEELWPVMMGAIGK